MARADTTQGQSVSVSAQDGIVELGKAHTHSAPSLINLPKVAFETVPIFVWLNTDRSLPWRVESRLCDILPMCMCHVTDGCMTFYRCSCVMLQMVV